MSIQIYNINNLPREKNGLISSFADVSNVELQKGAMKPTPLSSFSLSVLRALPVGEIRSVVPLRSSGRKSFFPLLLVVAPKQEWMLKLRSRCPQERGRDVTARIGLPIRRRGCGKGGVGGGWVYVE